MKSLMVICIVLAIAVPVSGELVTIRDDRGNMQMLEVSRSADGKDIQIWNYSKPTGFVTGNRYGGTDTYHDYGTGRNLTIDSGPGSIPILMPGMLK